MDFPHFCCDEKIRLYEGINIFLLTRQVNNMLHLIFGWKQTILSILFDFSTDYQVTSFCEKNDQAESSAYLL